jgi:hypothetical protein
MTTNDSPALGDRLLTDSRFREFVGAIDAVEVAIMRLPVRGRAQLTAVSNAFGALVGAVRSLELEAPDE